MFYLVLNNRLISSSERLANRRHAEILEITLELPLGVNISLPVLFLTSQ